MRISNLTFINAIPYIMENSSKWRALPSYFGKWQSVYSRFRRWSRGGVLDRLFAALRDLQTDGADVECFGLDSTSAEVHPNGTGARKTSGPQSIGKSHTQIHMISASDHLGVIFRLSGGQAHDTPEGRTLLESWDKLPANAPLAMDAPTSATRLATMRIIWG